MGQIRRTMDAASARSGHSEFLMCGGRFARWSDARSCRDACSSPFIGRTVRVTWLCDPPVLMHERRQSRQKSSKPSFRVQHQRRLSRSTFPASGMTRYRDDPSFRCDERGVANERRLIPSVRAQPNERRRLFPGVRAELEQ